MESLLQKVEFDRMAERHAISLTPSYGKQYGVLIPKTLSQPLTALKFIHRNFGWLFDSKSICMIFDDSSESGSQGERGLKNKIRNGS